MGLKKKTLYRTVKSLLRKGAKDKGWFKKVIVTAVAVGLLFFVGVVGLIFAIVGWATDFLNA